MTLSYLQYPPVPPEPGTASGAVIFLHGLGAGADDFASLPSLLSLSPSVRYLFPQAPTLPVTVNGGMPMPAWYDIRSMSLERECDPETVSASVHLLSGLLDQLLSEGIPAERIILGGFSQGGAMALETGFNYSHPLAGIISLSAYCLSPQRVTAGEYDHRKEIPLLLCHGVKDQVVPFALGERHQKIFTEKGFDLEWYREEGLGHNLSPDEVEVIKIWLGRFPFLQG